ncbi:MAG: radical SAM protein [Clostridia bacterium]|nr:radical SAM protein [Clostridia bacterium]MBQ3603838.1 radical SAM protein [Clostridia bacterium]
MKNKKNIYLVQPTYMNDTSIYFPYAIGALASYAWKFSDIEDNYKLKNIFFLRKNTDMIVSEMVEPFLVGFSNYIWNFEYNKLLASKIKKKFPDCVIVFGGPQIANNSLLLSECSYIDILIHLEGEVAFCELLRAFLYNNSLDDINNISYRSMGNGIITNEICMARDFDFPSPYESGFFDRLCEENPEIDFIPLIETNRGCPNNCSYCSWGKINSKVRFFPMDRVLNDLMWVSKNKKEFLGFADANFGMFPRDEIITDKIIELNEKTGFPKKFQVSYTKDSGDRVFDITQKLNKNGMDKGVTLSFQSMSTVVQNNIGRSNLDVSYYKKLLKKYAEASIPTYTDLILGLPGETYDSFKNGIDDLLELGQHTSLFVHFCEYLPLAEMAQESYIKSHGIVFSKIPLNQPHMSFNGNEEVQEYSHIVTQTNSMSCNDWKKTVLFSVCVLCFHHLGILQLIAIYLRENKGIKYSCFYEDLLCFLLKHKNFKIIEKKISDIVDKNEAAVVFDEKFGNIAWPFEEYLYLKTIEEKTKFFSVVKLFLLRYEIDEEILEELISYQVFVIKEKNISYKKFTGKHDWKEYFLKILKGDSVALKEKKVCYSITDFNTTTSWEDYAKKVLWFGRRGGKNIYVSEITDNYIRDDKYD